MQLCSGSSSGSGSGSGEDATATRSTFTAKIVRVASEMEFAECLNLFVLYLAAMGVASAVVVTQYLEFVVFDTVRQKGEPWQVAFELLVIMNRRIEDSGGSLNFANVYNESHLNSIMDEARRNATHFYPKLSSIFRSPGGNPGAFDGGKKPFNGKFTASSKRCCPAYNNKGEHQPSLCHPDGTCKFNHMCKNWVSDKGPYGKCLGPHPAPDCTNPNKCNDPIKA